MNIIESKIRGAVYGMAFGDAWGFPLEFKKFSKSILKHPEPPKLLKITDDTQMSLYNIKALQEIFRTFDKDVLNEIGQDVALQNDVRNIFIREHVKFSKDPENYRAPGITTMEALEKYNKLKNPSDNDARARNNSKGCGTIMRAPWIGLLPLDREAIATISVLQSQTTHGHTTAWVASAIASLIVQDLYHEAYSVNGDDTLLRKGLSVVSELRDMKNTNNIIEECSSGFYEVENAFAKALKNWDGFVLNPKNDMNDYFGEGWVAEETLMNALASASFYSPGYVNSPYEGISKLVHTRGDSDSIAAVGGALLGAYNGYEAFDYPIAENVEDIYKDELNGACEWLLSIAVPV